MSTCAEILAATLREAGVDVMFGLPGGEILDVIEAARREGIRFILTRHESTAAFMADALGQMRRRPAVCVSTLGPGAVNMTLGVANAFLDRSPLLAITASLATGSIPYATHQQLDLNDVYRPFTKATFTLDGSGTAGKIRRAIETATARRMGPVHIAVPSDIARAAEQIAPQEFRASGHDNSPAPESADRSAAVLNEVALAIDKARRPVLIVGLDVNPVTDTHAVRTLVDRLRVPTFVTPKAKGIVAEDHPMFGGVCAGVAADPLFVEFFGRADLLVGIGFDPVESDKLWHQTLPLVSIGPVSIAANAFAPRLEAVGNVCGMLSDLAQRPWKPFEWDADQVARFRADLDRMLRPERPPRGLSGYELTRQLRALFPRETIFTTDVGSIKMIASQAWTTYEPLTFFESNGLSAMSYAVPAAMAARLHFPERPILCTIGDGGFGMRIAELETCVREHLPFVTVVYNDSALSLIDVAQQNRGYPTVGVRHGKVDFAAAAAGFGVWSRRVETPADVEAAVRQALELNAPAVIDAVVDPAEYLAHHPRPRARTTD